MCSLHYEKFPDGSVKCIEEEIPFELPKGWEWARISSICLINPKNTLEDSLEVSFIPMPLIQEGFANFHSSDVKEWGKIKSGFTHFAEGDIAIAKITPCFENRKSVIFSNLKNGYGAGTTELHILRPMKILPEYILWTVKSENFISKGIQSFTGAVGQQRIGKEFVSSYLVSVPPVAEQHRIIKKIEQDFYQLSLIENEKKSLQILINQTKSKILDLAIHGKLVPQDPSDEPASVLLERIRAEKEDLIKLGKIKRDKKESVIFRGEDNSYYDIEIPHTWVWAKLNFISYRISDGSHNPPTDKGSGIPLLSAANIVDYDINIKTANRWITETEWLEEATRTQLETNDILLTIVGSIGRTAVVNTDNKFAFQRSVAIIKPCIVYSKYLMYILTAPPISQYLIANSKGTAQKGIYLKQLSDIFIPIPPVAEQSRIVSTIETAFAQLDEIANAIV